MTQFEIASAIRNYVTSAEGVTNFSLSVQQIMDEVDTLRSRLIGELDSKGGLHKPYSGYCLKATLDVKKFDTNSPFKGWSYVDCPRIFHHINGTPAVAYVGGTDLVSPYYVTTGAQHAKNIKASFFASKPKTKIAQYDESERIFRLSNFQGNKLVLEAILEKPSEFEPYGYQTGEVEDTPQHYPAPQKMIDFLIGKTAESYLRTMYRISVQPNTQSDIPQAVPVKK